MIEPHYARSIMLIGTTISHMNPDALSPLGRGQLLFRMKPWACLASVLMLAACSGGRPVEQQTGALRTIDVTRVVRIATTNDVEKPAAGQSEPKLTVSLGSPDELPEGPDGFDVTSDGNFLITDPLRKRIAVFDGNGGYRLEWQVGFAADSVTVLAGNLLQVREARTGGLHLFDMQGNPAAGSPSQDEPAEARLTGPGAGVVVWRAASGRPDGPVEVTFEKPGSRLLSLQAITMDSSGDTYVALESTRGSHAVDLNKIVRRYSANG